METAVRKATRLDYEGPKQKHLQTLIGLTFQNPQNAVAIIDLLEKRLKENSWIIVFKVLITIHTLMNHGDEDRIISYIQTKHSVLDTSRLRQKSSGKGVVDIQNIYLYSDYLEQKVAAYRNLNHDYIKNTGDNHQQQQQQQSSRLRHMTVEGGLLKDTMVLQKQLETLLKCQFIFGDGNNGISLAAFRLVIEDLLKLFQVINESIVNILEHYFEMSKVNARQSLDIYKRFERQAENTISFLEMAKRLQNDLNMPIPNIKHAPLSLSSALEEYLNEESKPESKSTTTPNVQQPSNTNNNNASVGQNMQPQQQSFMQQPQQANPAEDFFSSIANERVNLPYNFAQAVTPFSQQPQQSYSAPLQQQPQQLTFPTQQQQQQQQQLTFPTQQQQQQQLTYPTQQQQQSLQIFNPVSPPPQQQQQQPFQALPAPTSTSLQSPMMTGGGSGSGHNPFRSSTLIIPSTTGTSYNSSHSNPFRSSTLPSFGSSSSPNFNTFTNNNNNSHHLQQVTSFNTGNPFSSNVGGGGGVQTMSMSPSMMSANLNHNPFSTSNQQPQQPQPQWGSSIF